MQAARRTPELAGRGSGLPWCAFLDPFDLALLVLPARPPAVVPAHHGVGPGQLVVGYPVAPEVQPGATDENALVPTHDETGCPIVACEWRHSWPLAYAPGALIGDQARSLGAELSHYARDRVAPEVGHTHRQSPC